MCDLLARRVDPSIDPADHRRRLGAGDSAAERHVRDESGAVLPGVTVTVTQTDTGLFAPP